MLYRGLLGSEYSGRVDGLVASRNRGSEYFRELGPTPVPPGGYSSSQLNLQDAVRGSVAAWKAMSADDRDGWERWARQQDRPDRIGRRHTRTGFNEYIRWASYRAYANTQLSILLTIPDAPPIGPQIPLENAPRIREHNSSDPRWDIYFHNTDLWANASDGGLLVQISRQIPPTRNRAYGGFTLALFIPGAAIPPASPVQILLPFTPGPGDRVYARFRATSPTRGMSFATQDRGVST